MTRKGATELPLSGPVSERSQTVWECRYRYPVPYIAQDLKTYDVWGLRLTRITTRTSLGIPRGRGEVVEWVGEASTSYRTSSRIVLPPEWTRLLGLRLLDAVKCPAAAAQLRKDCRRDPALNTRLSHWLTAVTTLLGPQAGGAPYREALARLSELQHEVFRRSK